MKNRQKKNPSKINNHILLQVGQPVKDGFNESLKDLSKKVFSSIFYIILLIITNYFKK